MWMYTYICLKFLHVYLPAKESSWMRVFDPVSPRVFDLYH